VKASPESTVHTQLMNGLLVGLIRCERCRRRGGAGGGAQRAPPITTTAGILTGMN